MKLLRKELRSKLDPFGQQLEDWFQNEKLTAKQAARRLAVLGCEVSISRLNIWWARRRAQLLEERMLQQIENGAKHCGKIEELFAKNPAPAIATLMNLYRVLVLKVSNEANADSRLMRLGISLMKPLLEWSRIEDKRKELELVEQAQRDQAAAKTRAGGLRPETLEKIERELGLI